MMMGNPARSTKSQWHPPFRFNAAVLLTVALFSSGCGVRKRPSLPWASAVQVKPVLQTRAATAGSATEEAAPEFNMEMPPFASLLIPVHSGPVRPRTGAPPSGNSGTETEKTAVPVIAPQLSRQESAAAQDQANQSLAIAEKNLAAARGKKLNATQSDMVSKINGFLRDAREAAQSGDWGRARNLAKKAEVLSAELVGSL
jgi:hypothetical protein